MSCTGIVKFVVILISVKQTKTLLGFYCWNVSSTNGLNMWFFSSNNLWLIQLALSLQVIMRNLTAEEVSVFTYEDWLSKTRGPKRTMICEMAAVVDEEIMVELTTYIVQVKTSDVAGNCNCQVNNDNYLRHLSDYTSCKNLYKLSVLTVHQQVAMFELLTKRCNMLVFMF